MATCNADRKQIFADPSMISREYTPHHWQRERGVEKKGFGGIDFKSCGGTSYQGAEFLEVQRGAEIS